MGRMVRARAVASCPVESVFPNAAQPFAVPKHATPKGAIDESSGAEQTTHHYSAFERAAVPVAFEQDRASIYSLLSKSFAVIKLALLQY